MQNQQPQVSPEDFGCDCRGCRIGDGCLQPQPKFSEDLEKAITELAELIYSERNIRNKEGLKVDIGHWLSANRLVKEVEDQGLPENPYEGWEEKTRDFHTYQKAQQDMTTQGWRKVYEQN